MIPYQEDWTDYLAVFLCRKDVADAFLYGGLIVALLAGIIVGLCV